MNISLLNGNELSVLYDKLLQKYWKILDEAEINPYVHIGKQVLIPFRPRHWIYLMNSARKFIKIPNTLQQELIGWTELMNEVKSLNNGEIESILTMNDINLERLYHRNIIYNICGTLSFLVVTIAIKIFENLNTSIAIKIFENLNTSIAIFTLIYIVGIVLLAVIINYLILSPRIRFVRAFGDIIKIEKARRQQ